MQESAGIFRLDIQEDKKFWDTITQSFKSAYSFLRENPEILALEFVVLKQTEPWAYLLGSPSSWTIRHGSVISSDHDYIDPLQASPLWRMGREKLIVDLSIFPQKTLDALGSRISILIMPSLVIARDYDLIEEICEYGWDIRDKTSISAHPSGYGICAPKPADLSHAKRIKAQAHHAAEILSAEIGVPVKASTTHYHVIQKEA